MPSINKVWALFIPSSLFHDYDFRSKYNPPVIPPAIIESPIVDMPNAAFAITKELPIAKPLIPTNATYRVFNCSSSYPIPSVV